MKNIRPQGHVLWITGLSGAGKTSIAKEIFRLLSESDLKPILVDGDTLREVMGFDLGHDLKSRKINADRLSRICKWLSEQGHLVVCATMSLFRETHDWNRKHIPGYFEVYIRVPMDILSARHPKKLYTRAQAGEVKDVIGVDLEFDEPFAPDLVVENSEHRDSFEAVAKQVIASAGLETHKRASKL